MYYLFWNSVNYQRWYSCDPATRFVYDNHLYAYEAGMIAEKANVKELLLTHFYPEIDKQKYVDEAL